MNEENIEIKLVETNDLLEEIKDVLKKILEKLEDNL